MIKKPYSLTLGALFLFVLQLLPAQNPEFEIFPNGLIYSEQTMNHLSHIIDSLELQFKSCDLDRDYYSMPQSKGSFFEYRGEDLNSFKKAIEAGLSLAILKEQFPNLEVETQQLIIAYTNSDNDCFTLAQIPINYGYAKSIELCEKNLEPLLHQASKYIYKIHEKRIRGFFLDEGLHKRKFKEEYARLVQYVDCMIDTSAYILLEREESKATISKATYKRFFKLVNNYPGRPVYDSKDDETYEKYELYLNLLDAWEKARIKWIDKELSKTKAFNQELDKIVAAAHAGVTLGTELEFYVGRYRSKVLELASKRSRRVVGMCSQDDGPRIHALEIAKLAAETQQWDIFLRAHLNIMNDRFDRASDGSYAWARRKTYIKELEQLGINMPDLLLGTGLRSSNTSDNHYFSYAGRLGRALSESEDKAVFETRLKKMFGDEDLDDYNRLLMFYIYRAILQKDEDLNEEQKQITIEEVKGQLPAYIQGQISEK